MTTTVLKRRVCTICGKEKTIRHGFYKKNRSHCILCERKSSRQRMQTLDNRAKCAYRKAKLKATQVGTVDTLTMDDVIYLFKLANGHCAYNGKPSDNLSLEHIIPLAKGGSNSIGNVLVVDLGLNKLKKDSSMMNFIDTRLNPYDTMPLVKLLAARGNRIYKELSIELEQFQHEECNEEYQRVVAAFEKRNTKKDVSPARERCD